MSPVAVPADRRFRRSHVRPVRRRARWWSGVRTLFTIATLVGVLLFALYRAETSLRQISMLTIDRIVVSGNDHLSAEAVREALRGMRNQNIVFVDLGLWRQHLLATPWVRDAVLRRSLPSTVRVLVSERQVVALGRVDGDLYLIDESGALLDRYGPAYTELDVPIVDGLTPGVNQPADPARAALASRLLASIAREPELAHLLSQVDVADVRNAAVILKEDAALIYLGQEQFVERLQMYRQLASTLREQVQEIDSVDMRFDDRVYVRPAHQQRRATPVALKTAGSGQ